MRHLHKRSTRGLGLIESIISMAILGIALVGLTQLQLVAVGSNSFSRKMTQATSIGHDLVENISQWEYNDPRLASGVQITGLGDAAIGRLSDLPRTAEIADANRKPHFAAEATNNAIVDEALVLGGLTYSGMSGDLDGDGEAEYERYWSVFDYDDSGDGVDNGKLVVVVVRWREAGIGFRQVVISTFRNNPGNFTL